MGKISKIQEIGKEIHELQVNLGRLQWSMFTTGYDFGVEDAYSKFIDGLKNKAHYEEILNYKEKELEIVEKRNVEILYNLFKPYHLSEDLNKLDMEIQQKVNELSKILNTFRNTFDGKSISSVELNQILSTNKDREVRKRAYFTKNQIDKPMVDAGFIDLINLRKEYAKLYGAKDFISYKLEEDELDVNIFDNWISQLHEMLPTMNEAREKYAKKIICDDRIMPWDEQYIDSIISPSLNKTVDMSNYYTNLKEMFDTFGIDISKFNITYDIFPRANKSEWGYNFPIETAKDSRILANVKNKYYEYGVLLHETGHGIHSFLLNPEEIILNEGVSGIISEGIANLFQGFLYKPAFYSKFFTDADKVENEFSALREYRKLNSLRAINRIFFDHSLYKNNITSLDDIYDLYWKNSKEVLKEEPFGEAPPWAYTIHFTTHPIYLHNYFMGDVTCEMLTKVFKERFNAEITEKPKDFGEFLINEIIKPSGRYKYNELFKKISGNDFSLKYML
ncbi:M3 family metallopeptidase [Alkaliphilus peptidifermentans]|uniref:Peptidase family M3 n=1 Tax=Alkaliphilus peptidifermentans DSM 18978 TaxID=1120976 RepID=A0A1G5J476_9FIRM|nr:M3 family metallopeptidase [Alkaliphilus peptidifermentans]SCY82984.1 Peptidase family M3 [Alkaliphilus peptidifermentans DSM 18978]